MWNECNNDMKKKIQTHLNYSFFLNLKMMTFFLLLILIPSIFLDKEVVFYELIIIVMIGIIAYLIYLRMQIKSARYFTGTVEKLESIHFVNRPYIPQHSFIMNDDNGEKHKARVLVYNKNCEGKKALFIECKTKRKTENYIILEEDL